MTPHFADLVNPTFRYVLDLVERIENGEHPGLEDERNTIREELDQAEMTAASPNSPVKAEDFRLAKLALVYWVDEVMTEAELDWGDYTLEREYFGSKDRAWKFYVDGELKARNSSADVIETWYLALVLGFHGDIQNAFREHLKRDLPGSATDPDEARTRWARDLARQIRSHRVRDLAGEPLEGDVRPLTGTSLLRTTVPWTAGLLVAFVVLLFLWLQQGG